MGTYESLAVEIRAQVATVSLFPLESSLSKPGVDLHWDIGGALNDLREDNDVRVVILTGASDAFLLPPSRAMHTSGRMAAKSGGPAEAWRTFTGIVRAHQVITEMEKIVIAKVNGDAMGLGLSLALASDFVIAADDARFIDHHLGIDEIEGFERDWGIVPGDGGVTWAPLHFPPCIAKEFLMLAKPFSGRQLAEKGIINAAVPKEELDSVVDQYVQRLLKRSAYALAWTKRVSNRMAAQQLNLTLDAGAAYEMVNYLQHQYCAGPDRKTLG